MDDMKAEAAKHHEDAAKAFEVAAKLHRDAAKQSESGNYPKAQTLSLSAGEAESQAALHAGKATSLYRQHDEENAAKAAEEASVEAAREAKRESKAG